MAGLVASLGGAGELFAQAGIFAHYHSYLAGPIDNEWKILQNATYPCTIPVC